MAKQSEDIPADLQRQLAAIERDANALSTGALTAEAYGWPEIPRAPVRNTPALHALRSDLRGASREAIRVKDISLWVIFIGLGLAGLGIAGLRLDYVWLGLGALVSGGFVIGFCAIALYMANERVNRANTLLEREQDK